MPMPFTQFTEKDASEFSNFLQDISDRLDTLVVSGKYPSRNEAIKARLVDIKAYKPTLKEPYTEILLKIEERLYTRTQELGSLEEALEEAYLELRGE